MSLRRSGNILADRMISHERLVERTSVIHHIAIVLSWALDTRRNDLLRVTATLTRHKITSIIEFDFSVVIAP